MRNSRFEAVIFDVGDILYDASLWRRWLTARLQEEGVGITYPELVVRWEALLVDVYCGRAEYWERFDHLIRGAGLNGNLLTSIRNEAQRKGQDVQHDRVAMPGVVATLRQLRSNGVKLAALSDTENGEAAVRGILRQIEVEEFFDSVVASADTGVVKPDPAAYQAAAAALDVAPETCAFVGHDIDELEGAREAGLFAVAYNYHPDAPADVYIDDFSDLIAVVLMEEVEGA